MKLFAKIALVIVFVLVSVVGFFLVASLSGTLSPEEIRYGVTFSKFRTDELKLDSHEVYEALLTDLKVRRLRLVAHWTMVEPQNGVFDFTELDYQMRRAEEEGAEVILAVGTRLPSWPECHVPEWAKELTQEERDQEFFTYLEAVVERYKNSPALKWWQVENEPFIIGFAFEQCGLTNHGLLDVEVGFVEARDPHHGILLTASGELGLWAKTWERGDVFGTTLYRRVWNRDLDSFITYPTWPGFYRAQRTFAEWMTGEQKPAIIAELAAEPWPMNAIVDTPLAEQYARMDIGFLEKTVDFAARTGFPEQYFWGAEWWYYLKEVHGETEIWEWARQFFRN